MHKEILQSPWLCELIALHINLRETKAKPREASALFYGCYLTFNDGKPSLTWKSLRRCCAFGRIKYSARPKQVGEIRMLCHVAKEEMDAKIHINSAFDLFNKIKNMLCKSLNLINKFQSAGVLGAKASDGEGREG
ncbi:E3 ubiquitin-protein ligase BAH1 [Glycine soja]